MKNFTLWAAAMSLSLGAFAQTSEQPVAEEPQGTVQWYSVRSNAYSVSGWGFIDHGESDGIARKAVFTDDGSTVWFRNPISKFPTDTWVKASIEGDQCTLPLNQVIRISEDKNGEEDIWTIGAMKYEEVYNPETDSSSMQWVKYEADNMTYTYADGIFTQNEEGIMLALFCDGEYMIYGDVDTRMYPVDPNSDIVHFPEGVETEIWTLSYGLSSRSGHLVEVARQGEEVFIKGFWDKSASATIKGNFDGEKLTIPAKQYLGYTKTSGIDYFIYFMTEKLGTSSFLTYYQATAEPLVFNYDAETGKFVREEGSELGMMVKGGYCDDLELTNSQSYMVLVNPEFKVMDENYTQPLAPNNLGSIGYRVFNQGVDIPFVQYEFNILPFDLNGNAFKQENLFYTMWVDDERVLIEAGDFPNYKDVPEPTYEMPLDFKNNWGIMYDDENIFARRVQIPGSGIDKVGAQVIYIDPVTGESYGSLITYYYPATQTTEYEEMPTTSVKNVMVEGEVESVVYYDMLGNQVAEGFRGLCVKSVRYTNGQVVSTKVYRY